jgi:hypothetical protein
MGIATSLKRHCVETVSRQSPAVLVCVTLLSGYACEGVIVVLMGADPAHQFF